MSAPPPRLVLVGRSALFLDALSRIIESSGMTLAAVVRPTPAALDSLRAADARIAILEASGTVTETATILHTLRSGAALLPIVAGAEYSDEEIVDLIEAGCCGCVPRDATMRHLIEAIDATVHGRALFSPRVTGQLCARVRDLAREMRGDGVMTPLTPRELDVLRLAARGHTNKEIAQQLGVWLQTVKSHLHNAYEKLGVRSRREAVARAVRIGLLRDE